MPKSNNKRKKGSQKGKKAKKKSSQVRRLTKEDFIGMGVSALMQEQIIKDNLIELIKSKK